MWVAGRVDRRQSLLGPLRGMGEHRVDELGPGGEVPVQGGPADPGRLGDLAHAHVRVARQAGQGGVQDRAGVAPGVGPQVSRVAGHACPSYRLVEGGRRG